MFPVRKSYSSLKEKNRRLSSMDGVCMVCCVQFKGPFNAHILEFPPAKMS